MQMDGNCIDIDMYIYIYIHANTHGLQTSHHQDLRQFGNQEEHAFKTFTIDVASEI